MASFTMIRFFQFILMASFGSPSLIPQNIRSNSGSPFLEELKQARLHGILEVLRTVQLEQSSQFRAKVERRQLLQLVESGCAYRSVVTSDLILVDETNFPSKRFVSKVRIDLGCCTSNVWFGSAQ